MFYNEWQTSFSVKRKKNKQTLNNLICSISQLTGGGGAKPSKALASKPIFIGYISSTDQCLPSHFQLSCARLYKLTSPMITVRFTESKCELKFYNKTYNLIKETKIILRGWFLHSKIWRYLTLMYWYIHFFVLFTQNDILKKC